MGENGGRYLLKAGSGALKQEPFNEAAATALYEHLLEEGEYVPYRVVRGEWSWMSSCPCMADASHSFVDARSVFYSIIENGGSPDKVGMVRALEALGIHGAEAAIDKMLVCDFLLGNIDRHMGNFGAIMNSDTGEYIEDFPRDTLELNANPFAPRQATQLAMVRDFSWLDSAKLSGVADIVCDIVRDCPSRYMDSERANFLHAFVESNAAAVIAAANCAPGAGMDAILDRAEKIESVFAVAMRKKIGGTVFPFSGGASPKTAADCRPMRQPIAGKGPRNRLEESPSTRADKRESAGLVASASAAPTRTQSHDKASHD